jgi:hypothetical protein
LQLEQKIESLASELKKRDEQIAENQKQYEKLSNQFEKFKIECFNSINEELNEKYNKELKEKLDDVSSNPTVSVFNEKATICFYFCE